ncbi:MAG: twin-arginine translocation signal domain-containing protein, partial [Armatimonadota bacterium]|nr:twin-arginine translocation signal domain-containing protein [Armatimonadota bacterium]
MDGSRRKFLRQAGMALAGAVFATKAVKSRAEEVQEKRMGKASKKVRIGVVGGGFGAAFHWHRHPNCIVEAVSDLREDRRKHLQNVYKCDKAYNSLEELIKDKNVDAV